MSENDKNDTIPALRMCYSGPPLWPLRGALQYDNSDELAKGKDVKASRNPLTPLLIEERGLDLLVQTVQAIMIDRHLNDYDSLNKTRRQNMDYMRGKGIEWIIRQKRKILSYYLSIGELNYSYLRNIVCQNHLLPAGLL